MLDFAEVVQVAGDGVIVCDAAGTIVCWNAAATRIFGFTEQDAVGQSLDLIIPQGQRQRHWDGYNKTLATGETRYGSDVLRVPALHKEGRPLSIAFTVALLHGPGIVAVVRDDTVRWQAERALKARVRELETLAAPVTQGELTGS
jgi:PAS domain S-box-containing protein